jgi:hypothetical protein
LFSLRIYLFNIYFDINILPDSVRLFLIPTEDHMSSEIVFFVFAGFLALLTIFLGISNWVFLSSLSVKISGLEDEIEKKTLEFEAYKKERQSSGGQQIRGGQQSSDRTGHATYEEPGDQRIEIVRNVPGGGFENYDAETGNAPVSAPEPAAESARAAHVEPDQQSDVLDVVDESAAAPRSGAITLTLFSNAKKDTDFAAAWQRLAQVLPDHQNPRIDIDFSNVMFLYDRELQYLEKFRDVILRAGGTVAFVNCEAELMSILRKSPLLAAHVAGTETARR